MRVAYLPGDGTGYRGLDSHSPVDRRRLAALIPVWNKLGIEMVRWEPGIACDILYIVNLPASLASAEHAIRIGHSRHAVVVGIIEDLGTGRWASMDAEAIDDLGALRRALTAQQTTPKGRARQVRDLLAEIGVVKNSTTRIRRLVAKADAVVCTSELQAAALRHVNIFCVGIADCIPESDYAEWDTGPAEELLCLKRSEGSIVLVWEGTKWGLQLLELIREPLERLNAAGSTKLRLVFVSDRERPPLFGMTDNERILSTRFSLPTSFFPWSKNTIGTLLRACDIGLAPMPRHNPFYRAKAFSKPLAYMTIGLPVVASNIPSYSTLIQHGVNGFLAEGPDTWFNLLKRLVDDPELRCNVGNAARRRVNEFHSVEHVAALLAEVFRDAHLMRRV